jgi:hypothetical protein
MLFKVAAHHRKTPTSQLPPLPSLQDMMGNATFISILFGMLSLLPGNRYIALGFVSAALIIYAANRQRPSRKLGRVERKIQACEETLKLAKTNCTRNYLELTDRMRQLLE